MLKLHAFSILLCYSLAQASDPVASLPFQGAAQGRIVIDARINDQGPFPFLFDTGSINIISLDLAKQLGLNVKGKRTMTAFGGSVETAAVVLDSIKLGELTMGRTEVTAIGGGPFTTGSPRGMLGWEFLSKLVVEIDYEGSKLNFYDPKTYAYTGRGIRLPLTVQGTNMLTIPGTVFGSAAALQLDTGSEAPLVLFPRFVQPHRLHSDLQAVTGYGFGGLTRAMVMRAPSLNLGSYAVRSLIVHLSLDKVGIESGAGDGNIGSPLLRQFKCVFDVPHNSFYLEPNKWFGEPEPTDRSGLVLDTRSGPAKVLFVYPGSPAAESRIDKDDELTSGKGQVLTDYQWHDLLDQAPGTTVGVTVRHGNQSRHLALDLRDYVSPTVVH